jgi:RNA polymerase sigma factor (sigma-70 family)
MSRASVAAAAIPIASCCTFRPAPRRIGFTLLVERHGPLVWGVCWRVLQQVQDAEDAFQAAFLVLACRSGAINWHDSVANWLYETAHRLASELKTRNARRWRHEQQAAAMISPATLPNGVEPDLPRVLEEELCRLPARYRQPILLCHLEGRTGAQAARQLGWSVRTLQRRLEQARSLLRSRLIRRGLALSVGGLGVPLSENLGRASVPLALLESTIKAAMRLEAGRLAGAAVSVQVINLVERTVRAMYWTKLKAAAAVLVLVGAAGTGLFFLSGGASGGDDSGPPTDPAQRTARAGVQNADEGAPEGTDDKAPGEDARSLAAERARSMNNLKQLALAMKSGGAGGAGIGSGMVMSGMMGMMGKGRMAGMGPPGMGGGAQARPQFGPKNPSAMQPGGPGGAGPVGGSDRTWRRRTRRPFVSYPAEAVPRRSWRKTGVFGKSSGPRKSRSRSSATK